MNKLYKKSLAFLASAAMMANMTVPALASTNLQITGNGADSEQTVTVNRTSTVNVVQSNDADINNDVNVKAETGDNEASKNTTGNVEIDTGDATSTVGITNDVNKNMADVQNCGTCAQDTEVMIDGNAADSNNAVNLKQTDATLVVQTNEADVENDVDAEADTGNNEANKNTNGDVDIETGKASTIVGVSTMANRNTAKIGGSGSGAGSSLSARILANGADSVNSIDLDLAHIMDAVQSNRADVENDVEADSETGENEAEKNTGGSVEVDTGDATTVVGIDNMTNFNTIDLGCDCVIEDIMAKIADNGADSDNYLVADIADTLGAFQSNCAPLQVGDVSVSDHRGDCEIDNDVDAKADTGDNDVDENTASSEYDPSVETGDAEGTVLLSNHGNENIIGSGVASDPQYPTDDEDEEEPTQGGGYVLDIHLDISEILGLLGLL